jgi:undecaprenyl phosphate-alpha-L-ara4FN deformylase
MAEVPGMHAPSRLALKVDVCTHDGMRDGVPRLLDLFARQNVQATFCLAFGPDNAGKAVFQMLRPGFARKMVKSSATKLYGWRTMLSGTLLPARPIASAHPDLVRRIDAEGHEIAVHAWDHRRWQDHLAHMDEREIESHFERSFGAYEAILKRAPRAVGAAAWAVTPLSLRVQDALGLEWASDLRGGPPCRLQADGGELRTPQIPTTGRCIEELLTLGIQSDDALGEALLADMRGPDPSVLAVHAEVEGGAYLPLFERLLPRLRAEHGAPCTLGTIARSLASTKLPRRALTHVRLPGRSGEVSSSTEIVSNTA